MNGLPRHKRRLPVVLTHRARRRRELALLAEVRTLREIAAVLLADKAALQSLVDGMAGDNRNAIPLARYMDVCNRLHRAEDEIRHLKWGHLHV